VASVQLGDLLIYIHPSKQCYDHHPSMMSNEQQARKMLTAVANPAGGFDYIKREFERRILN
jgi:hypothetical protein